ncbi:MAG: hypothetical protein ACHQAY_13355 [Hyphomicrobiales bacterium]
MVSLWHAFDLAASLGVGERGQAVPPRAAVGRSKRAPPWLRAELLGPDEVKTHETAWRDLASRALVPNLFCEPEFALTAATHLARGQTPRFLLIFDERGHPLPRLIMLAPLLVPAFGVGEASLWLPELILSSTPLIDRHDADAAIDALLEAIRVGPARASGLRLPRLDEGGVFAGLVRQAVARSGREVLRFERPARAPLRPADCATHDGGRTVVARTPHRVREAVEHFLTIEALGPEGESGEALLLSPSASAFLRVVTRWLARSRRCHVELHLKDGKPVGADIFLRSGDENILWKTTGSSASGASDDGLASSQATAPSRAVTVDWLIAARPGKSPAILALAARDRLSRRLREIVKRAVRGS